MLSTAGDRRIAQKDTGLTQCGNAYVLNPKHKQEAEPQYV